MFRSLVVHARQPRNGRRAGTSAARDRAVPRTGTSGPPPSGGGAVGPVRRRRRRRPPGRGRAGASLRRIEETCVFTVVSPTTSALAISAFDRPCATSRRISSSRSVRLVERRRRARRRARSRAKRSSSRRVTVGREQRLAGGDDADRLDELGGPHVLEQEPARAGADRLDHVLVEVERGQDEDARGRARAEDADASPRRRPCPACGRPSGSRRGSSLARELDRLPPSRPRR